jgi:hypothetical protein
MDVVTERMLANYWKNEVPNGWKVLKIHNTIPGTYHCKVKVKGEIWNNHILLSRYAKSETVHVVAGICTYTKVLFIGPEFKVEQKKGLSNKDIGELRFNK